MKMKCGCRSSWKQIDFNGNEKPHCAKHDTYEIGDENKNTYNNFPILTDEEYDFINQKYIDNELIVKKTAGDKIKRIDIKPEKYLVTFFDSHGCFDESTFNSLKDAYHYADFGNQDGEYIIIYAIIEFKNKILWIELINTKKNIK